MLLAHVGLQLNEAQVPSLGPDRREVTRRGAETFHFLGQGRKERRKEGKKKVCTHFFFKVKTATGGGK